MANNLQNEKKLKSSVILSYVAMILSISVSLFYTPIMTRCLGQQEYGMYSLASSVIGYLSLLNFGLGNAVIRFATKLRAESRNKEVESIYGLFILIFSALAVLVIIIGGIVTLNVKNIFTITTGDEGYRNLQLILIMMIINLAISFPASVYNAIITSYENFLFLKIISIIQSLMTPIIVIPLLLSGYKAVTMTLVLQLLHIGCSFAYIFYVHCKLKVRISFHFGSLKKELYSSIFSYTAFILLGLIVDQLYWNTDKMVLGVLVNEVAVAVYTIGAMFHTYYQQFSGAISEVFFPRITRIATKENAMPELSALFIRVGRLQALILLLVFGGFVCLGREFLALWIGVGYSDSYWIAILVLFPATIPLIQSVGFLIIKAMNKHRFRAILYLCIAIANVVMSIPAAIKWGGIGCAACTCIAALVGHGIIMNWYYYKRIGLDVPKFWREIIKILLPAAAVCALNCYLNTLLPSSDILLFGAKAIVYCIIYFIAVYIISMNSYEKALIGNMLKKLKR